MQQRKVVRARLTWAQRIEASRAREARLMRWLNKLETRAARAREEKRPLSDVLALKLEFVKRMLGLTVRKTAWLREQSAKVKR